MYIFVCVGLIRMCIYRGLFAYTQDTIVASSRRLIVRRYTAPGSAAVAAAATPGWALTLVLTVGMGSQD